ncbi:TIM barrel protein [Ulvibacterium sp.]|uniref:sugar phosphate isomerase/epimerase family protein n=1 Tax=Ulvibacterium sp. TaxID=2665914 RepID=UPI00261C8579|nr:TIM barrel protein [Ulvibacterium sp.]
MNRRSFLLSTALMAPIMAKAIRTGSLNPELDFSFVKPSFKLSLAPWSLMRKPAGNPDAQGIQLMDYPMVARELGFKAIEQDNLHFPGELPNQGLLTKMKKRADEAGVIHTLLLCGALGDIADTNKNKRRKAIKKYQTWLEAAKFLGCYQMRIVCADRITISRTEKLKYAVEGVSSMAEYAEKHNMELLIENHNGYSSDPDWLLELIKTVGMKNCGILGDFTEWRMEHEPLKMYPDPYKGYKILAPHIKSVGAKSVDFDEAGNETNVDYFKMLQILADFEYKGYVAVEYFGEALPRKKGITMTKHLIEKFVKSFEE